MEHSYYQKWNSLNRSKWNPHIIKRNTHIIKRNTHIIKRNTHIIKRNTHIIKRNIAIKKQLTGTPGLGVVPSSVVRVIGALRGIPVTPFLRVRQVLGIACLVIKNIFLLTSTCLFSLTQRSPPLPQLDFGL